MTTMTTTIEASDRSRLARSSLIALGFWLAVAVALAVIPMAAAKPVAPKYSTVRLTLNEARQPATAVPVASASAPVAATSEPIRPAVAPTSNAPAKAAVPSAAPAVSRSAKAAAKVAAAKAAAAKAAQPAAALAKPAAQNSTAGGLGIPNFSTPVTGSTRSESSGEYLDFQSEERQPRTDSASPANVSSVSEFEGVAAPLASLSPAKPAVTGTSGAKPSPGAASGETERALGELAGAKAAGTTATNTSATGTSATAGTATSNSSAPRASSSVSSLAFDGVARKLIRPEEPSIVLPDDLARLITSNRSVVVSFTIHADGSVPAGLVEFSPSAVLPARVRDWLAREFSGWRFERSGEDGQARFSYSIKVE